MHIKNFNQWNDLKKIVNDLNRPVCRVREVRWCSIGHNIGSEIDGKGTAFSRPVVILKFLSSQTCFCVPLSTTEKTGKYLFEFTFQEKLIKARLDQVKVIDVKRLKDRVGVLSKKDFQEINNAVQKFLFS